MSFEFSEQWRGAVLHESQAIKGEFFNAVFYTTQYSEWKVFFFEYRKYSCHNLRRRMVNCPHLQNAPWRLQPTLCLLCHVTPTCPAHTSASACEKLAENPGESFALAGTLWAT